MSDLHSTRLTSFERSVSLQLSGLFSLRMLGVFIIIPIFALHAEGLNGVTPALAGLFMSSYALTQIILQPLFGSLSDRFGRKVMIILGLILFVVGSLIIALTGNIYLAILGRVIQGAGAIGAVILAFASDLTREAVRSKVMAMIGVTIGLTFGVAFFISPKLYALTEALGFRGGMGVFLLCAILGGLGIVVTAKFLPSQLPLELSSDESASTDSASVNSTFGEELHGIRGFRASFLDKNINRLYFGGMMVHLILTMSFAAFPFFLQEVGYTNALSWQIYVPSFLISILLLFPLVGLAEALYQHRRVFLLGIALIGVSMVMTLFSQSYLALLLLMMLFFLGFNILESLQPSLMSRFVPAQSRGMMMGVFSSSQFVGMAIGGQLGMQLHGYFINPKLIFMVVLALAAGWFYIAFSMESPLKKVTTQPKNQTAHESDQEGPVSPYSGQNSQDNSQNNSQGNGQGNGQNNEEKEHADL